MKTVIIALVRNAAGEVLSLKRAKGKDDGVVWSLPSGKVEPNETEEAAVIREVFEETGTIILPEQKIGERLLEDKRLSYWECIYVQGEPRGPINGETTEVMFRSVPALTRVISPDVMHPCIRKALGLN